MSIEYVVGRDYKDVDGVKWRLVHISKTDLKMFFHEHETGAVDVYVNQYCSRIVSEWFHTVTLNGEEVELKPWATCVAMDGDGAWYQYEKPPLRGKGGFSVDNGKCERILFKNWKDSLIKL